jgi:hypothetical protein
MPIETWRRIHGDLMADVVALWPDHYRVVVSNVRSGLTRELPRVYARVEAAKAAADELVRRAFGHRCDMEHCGTWLQWSATQ